MFDFSCDQSLKTEAQNERSCANLPTECNGTATLPQPGEQRL